MKNGNHPKDPMTGANGRLNNKQITLKKKGGWGIKGIEKGIN
jgi:hypothetical protein